MDAFKDFLVQSMQIFVSDIKGINMQYKYLKFFEIIFVLL
jgi:hypothetical protein